MTREMEITAPVRRSGFWFEGREGLGLFDLSRVLPTAS